MDDEDIGQRLARIEATLRGDVDTSRCRECSGVLLYDEGTSTLVCGDCGTIATEVLR